MLRILVADDHGIVRSGIRMLIERQEGMRVVAEASDGVEAVQLALAERPDIAILDVSMPRLTGTQAAREIRSHLPSTSVLLLSMHDDDRYMSDAFEAGAGGYVLKSQADADLVNAVRALARGESFLSPVATLEQDALTARELQVVKLIAEAHTNRQIADVLSVSEKTVESHRANLLAKLGMRDRVELVRYAIRRGLIEP